jgi:hypothetical protein
MHSINAFLGGPFIKESDFNSYITEYDKFMRDMYNIDSKISARDFDLVNSNQTNLVSYILKKKGYYTRYYALNTLYGKKLDTSDLKGDFIFVFNSGHIWGYKKSGGQWYVVDSLSGVRLSDISSLSTTRDIGVIMPVNGRDEYYRNVAIIRSILDSNKVYNESQLIDFLKTQYAKKIMLGDLEIPLNLCIDILDSKSDISIPKYIGIKELVTDYYDFLSKYVRGNILNVDLACLYIPSIIFRMIKSK